MKKQFLRFLFVIFACIGVAHADTITLNWLNENGTTNQTTTCETGGDLILPTTPTKTGYDFVGWIANFTPITYLESTGTQWIDTGFVPNLLNTQMKIVFSLNNATISNYVFLFGSGSHSTNTRYWLIINSNITLQIGYGSTYLNMDTPLLANLVYEYSVNISSQEVIFNLKSLNDNSVITRSSSIQTKDSNGTMALFTTNKIQGTFPGFSGKIYSVKLYDNNILVRDFIPVLDANGVACMFDLVESKFYYNAGTGDFIAGPIIDE